MKELMLIVGKSGTGKNYICQALNLQSIPSYTTRPIRSSELEGREHIFSTKEHFSEHNINKQVIAFTEYCKNYYWTTKEQFENNLYDVYIIDPAGVDYIKDYEYINGKIKRGYKIIYFKTNIFKRIINMRKRGDSYINILKRILNDNKVFKEFENRIKDDVLHDITVINV